MTKRTQNVVTAVAAALVAVIAVASVALVANKDRGGSTVAASLSSSSSTTATSTFAASRFVGVPDAPDALVVAPGSTTLVPEADSSTSSLIEEPSEAADTTEAETTTSEAAAQLAVATTEPSSGSGDSVATTSASTVATTASTRPTTATTRPTTATTRPTTATTRPTTATTRPTTATTRPTTATTRPTTTTTRPTTTTTRPPTTRPPSGSGNRSTLYGYLWGDGSYKGDNKFFFRTRDARMADNFRASTVGNVSAVQEGFNSPWFTFTVTIPGETGWPNGVPSGLGDVEAFSAAVIEGEGSRSGLVFDDPSAGRRTGFANLLGSVGVVTRIENRNVYANSSSWPIFNDWPFVVCGRVPGGGNC